MLKHLFLRLHKGDSGEDVRNSLIRVLGSVPYGLVVEAEQELISEGLPASEIQKFCDLHSQVLEGKIDLKLSKIIPPGHPLDVFKNENKAISELVTEIEKEIKRFISLGTISFKELMKLKGQFNLLNDIDKHYKRKEYLVFPYLEKKNITGPPTVMWGKHDEIRAKLKDALNSLEINDDIDSESFKLISDMFLVPALMGIKDMIYKENEILFPMCGDVILDSDWYEISKQTNEYGYCIVVPSIEWKPVIFNNLAETEIENTNNTDTINLESGSFLPNELTAILNTMPFDVTFVDKNDKVKYFSQGKERIFDRSKAILMRDVRMCHPPHSVHIVNQIIEDFRTGKQDRAPFWINMGGKFIHIEYFAVRDSDGSYLGTLEVSQNITGLRALEGEQRLLNYAEKE
jgi:DUF438 domain-containing protein